MQHDRSNTHSLLPRRRFLGLGVAAAAASRSGALVCVVVAPSRDPRCAGGAGRTRALLLPHAHRRAAEDRVLLRRRLSARRRSLKSNHILRDFRVNEIKAIDPALFDLLHELGGTLETDQPFHIISGYRSPQTNAMLRERGGASRASLAQPAHGRAGDRHPRPRREARTPSGRREVAEDRRRRLLSRPRTSFTSISGASATGRIVAVVVVRDGVSILTRLRVESTRYR